MLFARLYHVIGARVIPLTMMPCSAPEASTRAWHGTYHCEAGCNRAVPRGRPKLSGLQPVSRRYRPLMRLPNIKTTKATTTIQIANGDRTGITTSSAMTPTIAITTAIQKVTFLGAFSFFFFIIHLHNRVNETVQVRLLGPGALWQVASRSSPLRLPLPYYCLSNLVKIVKQKVS